jgi:hypothetical protein
MRSRGVNITNALGGEENPFLPCKTQQLYQNLMAFRLKFPLYESGERSRILLPAKAGYLRHGSSEFPRYSH